MTICLRLSVFTRIFYINCITVQVFVVYNNTFNKSLFVSFFAVSTALFVSLTALSLLRLALMFEM